MTAVIATSPKFQFSGADGLPLINGTLTTYLAGTTTPTTTWQDRAQATANTNPIVLDGNGECLLWLDPLVTYKFVLANAEGAQQWSVDNISGAEPAGLREALAASGGSALVGFIQSGTGAVATTVQTKLRESISVADFGAVGDGVTDDTAAIQAAITAAYAIDFGDSTKSYKVTADIVVPPNRVITGNLATITQYTALTQIFNIDTSDNISISGLRFVGLGTDYAESDGNPNATAIYTNSGSSNIRIFDNQISNFAYAGVRIKGASDVFITNNTITGLATLTPITNGRSYGVLIDTGCSAVLISGNNITKGGQGIRLEGSTYLRVTDNYIYDVAGQHGIYAGTDLADVVIANNTITLVPLIGIKVQVQISTTGNENIVINGNAITSCGGDGINIVHASGGTLQVVRNTNVVVSNNTIRDIAAYGMIVENTDRCNVSGNVIYTCVASGIFHSSCTLLNISGNSITNTGLSGIRDGFVTSECYIHHNTLKNCGTSATAADYYGIFIQTADSLSIVGNYINDTSGGMNSGIRIVGGSQTGVVLCDNQVIAAAGPAMVFATSSDPLRMYKNNVFFGTGGASPNNPAIYSVASAASITLPTAHNVVKITGTTNITAIGLAAHAGNVVTLVFADVLTVVRGVGLLVASDFTTSINDTLTMCCDGDSWLEIARSAN